MRASGGRESSGIGGGAGSGSGGRAAGTLDEAWAQLVPLGWRALHGVNWPGRPQARLDHVLVGPGGIVVVDVKDWTGEVRVVSGGLWQERFARPQAVDGALAQCAALTSVVAPQYRRLVRPLICMTAQPNLFGITATDVAVAGPAQLVHAVGLLPRVLDQKAVSGIHKSLGRVLTGDEQPGITGFPRRAGASGDGHAPQPEWDPSQLGRPAIAHPGRTAGPHLGGVVTAGSLAMLAAFVVFAMFFLPPWGP